MEFNGTQKTGAPGPQQPPRMPQGAMHMGNGSRTMFLVVGIALVVLIVACLAMWMYTGKASGGSSQSAIKSDKYQALFLTNGQVYFGKLTNVDDQYVRLTEIYYLQVQQAVQPGGNNGQDPKVSLAKLGSELHGPEDQMEINRDQVLFWENLKDDGKVVKTIKEGK